MNQWIQIALRNVWRNRRRSFFLAGTVAIGAMALLMFIAYIAATAEGLRESIIRGGTGHLQIAKIGHFDGFEEQQLQFGLSVEDRVKVQTILQKDKRVKRIVARLSFGGLVSNGQRTLTFQGSGTQPDRERQAFGIFQKIKQGEPLSADADQSYSAVLGQEMARRLGVQVGDTITVMTSTVFGSINAIDLQVAGTLSTGNPEADLYTLQLPLTTAQELLRTQKISRLAVLLTDTQDTEAVSADLQQQLSGLAEIKTWQQLVPTFAQVVTLYRNQFIVFGFIIGVVVFLGVSTMTLTNIFERSREIGTMRAIGIATTRIRLLLTVEGLLQGVIGVLGGWLLAAVCSWLINTIGVTLPPPPGRNVGVLLRLLWVSEYASPILLILPMIAMLAAFFISRRISRMPVVQALHDNH
jgi:putative ABC transport system permease protein